MRVNKTLLPIKGHFFLFWAYMASAPPFVMVVARQVGVPVGVQGVLSAVIIVIAVVVKPLVAALADTFPARRKVIFLVLIGIMVAALEPIGFLPPMHTPPRLSGHLVLPSNTKTGFESSQEPYFVSQYHHNHHHNHNHNNHHQSDDCVVVTGWDCSTTFQDIPTDSDVLLSIELIPKSRKKSQWGEEALEDEDMINRSSKHQSQSSKPVTERSRHITERSRSIAERSKPVTERSIPTVRNESSQRLAENSRHIPESSTNMEIITKSSRNLLNLNRMMKNTKQVTGIPVSDSGTSTEPFTRQKQGRAHPYRPSTFTEHSHTLVSDPGSSTNPPRSRKQSPSSVEKGSSTGIDYGSLLERWNFLENETITYKVKIKGNLERYGIHNVSLQCMGSRMKPATESIAGQDDEAGWEGTCQPAVLRQPVFWAYVVFLVIAVVDSSIVEAISDAICCDALGVDGSYGRQRVWGVVSYGLVGVLSGLLVDYSSGERTQRDYRPAFFLMTACGVLDLLLSAACLKVPRLEVQQKGVCTKLRPLLRHPHFLVFLVIAFFTGLFDGLDSSFIFVLQEDIASRHGKHHLNTAQGLTLLVQALSAVPFMLLGDWFIKKLGAQRAMNFVLFMYSIRLLGLASAYHMESLVASVVVELLNGPCFGLGYTAVVVHASHLAPHGLSNTVQGVVGVCYGTLGYAGASFVGGLMYEAMDGLGLYLCTGAVALLTWALHLIYMLLCTPRIKLVEEPTETWQQEQEEGTSLQAVVRPAEGDEERKEMEGENTRSLLPKGKVMEGRNEQEEDEDKKGSVLKYKEEEEEEWR